MTYDKGALVKLTNPASIARFGEGPFTVAKALPHIHAVELEEIGSIDLSEIAPFGIDAPMAQKELRPGPRSIASVNPVITTTGSLRRIETIAGSLLSHPDANVRLSAKEILRLLWREDEDELGHSGDGASVSGEEG